MDRLAPSTRVRIGTGITSSVGFASPDPLRPDTYLVVTPTATGERVDGGFVRDQLTVEPLTVANLTRGEVYAVIREAVRTAAATMHRVAWQALGVVHEDGRIVATDGEVQAARASIVAHLVSTASRSHPCEGDCYSEAPTRPYQLAGGREVNLCSSCAGQLEGIAPLDAELAAAFDRVERTAIPKLEAERDARDGSPRSHSTSHSTWVHPNMPRLGVRACPGGKRPDDTTEPTS